MRDLVRSRYISPDVYLSKYFKKLQEHNTFSNTHISFNKYLSLNFLM